MSAASKMADNRSYYDAFAQGYDDGRDHGYHRLIDDQAAALVEPHGRGADVLEVGCGTGLVLERVAGFARTAKGVDLSPGMLERAEGRGLDVQVADCTALPFDDGSFDLAYSFKVLAHVPEIDEALSEMLRVVKPGGHLVFDLYNRNSMRWLIKRLVGARATSTSFDEAAISTRFVTPGEAMSLVPMGARLVEVAGIRIGVPHPAIFRIPIVSGIARGVEWNLMRSPLWRVAGFIVLTLRKETAGA